MVWRQASFRQQLLVAFLVMALLPALLIALVAYARANRDMDQVLQQTQARNLQGAISARNYLAAALKAGERAVAELHDEPALLRAPPQAVRPRLRRLLADVPLGYDLTLFDVRGRVVASGGPPGRRPAGPDLTRAWSRFPERLQAPGAIISRAFRFAATGEPGLALARPMRRPGGPPEGLVVVSYNLGAYREQLMAAAAIGGVPSLYVIDQTGKLVFGTGGDTRFSLFQDLSGDLAFVTAKDVPAGAIGPYQSPVADHSLMGAFAVVPQAGWVVVVAADYDAIRAEALQNVRASLAMLLPAGLMALVGALLLSRWYARPVTDLCRMVRELPEGTRLTAPPSARTASEFVVLAEAIAETSRELARNAADLQAGRSNLERRLDERTRSLQMTNRVVFELAAARDLPRAFRRILPMLAELMGADAAMICRYDPERHALVAVAHHGDQGLDLPDAIPLADSAFAEAILAGRRWYDRDLPPDSPRPDVALLARAGFGARLMLPVRLRNGQLVGTLTFLCRDTRLCDCETAARLEPIAEQIAMAIDRDQLLRDMQARRQEAEDLARLAIAFAQSIRLDEVTALILQRLQESFHADRVDLWLHDTYSPKARCVGSVGLSADEAVKQEVDLQRVAGNLRRLERGEPLVFRDARELEADPSQMPRLQIESGVLLPLIANKELIGTLFLAYADPARQLPLGRLGHAKAIAAQAASAVANALLFDRLEERHRDAASLARVAGLLAQSLRLSDLAPALLGEMRTGFAADGTELWLIDPDRTTARCTAAVGPHASGLVGARLPRAIMQDWSARIDAGEPILVPDLLETPVAGHPLVQLTKTKAIAMFPLMNEGVAIGFILLQYAQPGAKFPAERLPYAQAIAAQAASAVANAWLFEQLEQRRLDAETLVRVANVLSRSVRLEAIAPGLLDELRSSFATDHATLWLVDEEGRTATCVAGVGERAGEVVGVTRSRAGVPGLAARLTEGGPVLIPDVTASSLVHSDLASRFGIRAAAYFPLHASGQLIGFLLLTYEREGAAFPEDRLNFALAIASQAASAVANARLFERLEAALVHLQSVQEQLIRSERLSALGQLSSFVSHEIKNRFNVIMTAASLAEMIASRPGAAERIKQTMATIKKEVDRGNDLMLRLLRFAKPKEPTREMVSLPAILDAALLTARRANVRIVRRLPESLPRVPGDPALLEQVFLNLILNALQAMPSGGTLTVTAARAGSWVEVTIGDTGVGMSRENQSHLFQPFYTTKAQGTGLGLVITRQIVDQHKGTIQCESEPGKGTTFTIRLPLPESQPFPPPDISEAEGGTGEQAA